MNITKRAFVSTIPIMAGYIVLGIGFGVFLKANGYGMWWSVAMGIFIYAGSMQYVLASLLSGGASLFTIGLTTLMVNARHLFYGISMVGKYKKCGREKPYLIFALTDETYSLVCDAPSDIADKDIRKYYLLVSVFDHAYWVTGCLLGGLAGELIKFNTEGVDFALTALFVTIFTDQWLNNKKHLSAVIGVVASVVSLVIFGSDTFLIPAMIMILVSLLIMKKFDESAIDSGTAEGIVATTEDSGTAECIVAATEDSGTAKEVVAETENDGGVR